MFKINLSNTAYDALDQMLVHWMMNVKNLASGLHLEYGVFIRCRLDDWLATSGGQCVHDRIKRRRAKYLEQEGRGT